MARQGFISASLAMLKTNELQILETLENLAFRAGDY
jgi:hypothetical protein